MPDSQEAPYVIVPRTSGLIKALYGSFDCPQGTMGSDLAATCVSAPHMGAPGGRTCNWYDREVWSHASFESRSENAKNTRRPRPLDRELTATQTVRREGAVHSNVTSPRMLLRTMTSSQQFGIS